MTDVVYAPWDDEFIEILKRMQANKFFHGYTCGVNSYHDLLEPTTDGWICPNCDYVQRWAHDHRNRQWIS